MPDRASQTEAAQGALAYYQGIPEIRGGRAVTLQKSYRFESEAIAAGTKRYYKASGVLLDCPNASTKRPDSIIFIDSNPYASVWRRYGASYSLANAWEAAAAYELAHHAAEDFGGLGSVPTI